MGGRGTPGWGRGDAPALDDPDELPRLMAQLGRLIARHGAGGVVAMARSEAERRELLAYAAGWQDAAAEFTPRVAAARRDGWLGRWRPLRVLNGPGDVIPFPVARQYAHAPRDRPSYDDAADSYPAGGHGEQDAPDDHHRDEGHEDELPAHARESAEDPGPGGPQPGAARRTPGAYADDPAHSGRDDGAQPAAGGQHAATRSHDEGHDANSPTHAGRSGRGGQGGAGRKPNLPAKSRWSRSPTIPRLLPQQRFPGRDPASGAPPADPPA